MILMCRTNLQRRFWKIKLNYCKTFLEIRDLLKTELLSECFVGYNNRIMGLKRGCPNVLRTEQEVK